MRILAPVDGSRGSDAAVDYLVHHTKEIGLTEVRVLYVQPPLPAKLSGMAKEAVLDRVRAEEAKRATATVDLALGNAGIRHTVVVETGDPAATIARYADLHQCDEIVMGTRGLGNLKGALLGSVAHKIVHEVKVPVLLVKERAAAV